MLPRSGFHGTRSSVLGPAFTGFLTSASERNTKPRYGYSKTDKTYFTPSEAHAWHYANEGLTLGNFKKQERPIVLPVSTADDATVEKDKNMPAVGNLSLTSDKPLEVSGEPEWGPPPSMYGGTVTQTALPNINWHQFGMPNWVVYRGDSPLYDNGPFTSIDAIMREAHPHLETRRVNNIIKQKKAKRAKMSEKPETLEDDTQLRLFD